MSTIYVCIGSASSTEFARIERAVDVLNMAHNSFRSLKVVVQDDSWDKVCKSVVEGMGFQAKVNVNESAACGAFAFSISSGDFLGKADAFLEEVQNKFGLTLEGSEEYFAGLAQENGERFNRADRDEVTIFAASKGKGVPLLRTVLGEVQVTLESR